LLYPQPARERDRTVIVQAIKFLLPFLVVSDVVATFVKLQHVGADALKRRWTAHIQTSAAMKATKKHKLIRKAPATIMIQTSATDEGFALQNDAQDQYGPERGDPPEPATRVE
jgi:hypothetical protein